eukprot:TRINITY_DN19487_c0_g1_i1.p1 TRINITY_DN19487_c0_g1~~TRINITY_DN19487_c0_g1_i1.p1  ORF type:complete len:751 (+),score=261.91 TRINITY_DN19487_c0_g1_i1:169-2421(+)
MAAALVLGWAAAWNATQDVTGSDAILETAPQEEAAARYVVERGAVDWMFLFIGLAVYTALLPVVFVIRKFGRSYYPLRIRYPGLSTAGFLGGFLWFAAQVTERQLLFGYDSIAPSDAKCWLVSIFRYLGISIFVNTMLCKQYHQHRKYVVVDPNPHTTILVVLALSIPWIVLMCNPYSSGLHCAGAGCVPSCLICGRPNTMWQILGGYLTFLLVPFAGLVRSLNDPCSYYPNMARSLTELAALFLMAGACHLMAWTAPVPTDQVIQESVSVHAAFAVSLFTVMSIVLPVGVFLRSILNPLYRFWTNDKEYARRLEHKMRVNIHLQAPRSGLLSSQRSIPNGVSGRAEFFEVERLAAHVESGDGDSVKRYLALTNVSNIHPVDRDGLTPLHRAIRNQFYEIAELLLNLGADADGRDSDGFTPLYVAARRGYVDGIYLLHRYGADSNARMKHQTTAAHVAVEYKQMGSLSLLISLGGKVNHATPAHGELCDDSHGWDWYGIHIHGRGWMRHHYKSPLTLAAELDYHEFVAFLAEASQAGPDSACSHGWNVLQLACALGHAQIVEYFSERADVLDFVSYTNPKDQRNAFHYCCIMGREECLGILMDQFLHMPHDPMFGAGSVRRSSTHSRTSEDPLSSPTAVGAAAGTPPPLDLAKRLELRDRLLNAQDYLGRTPLHYAVLGRFPAAVTQLLQGRVSTTLPDCPKGTPVKDTPSTSSFSTSYFAVQPCRGASPLEYAKYLNSGKILGMLTRAE